MVQLNYSTKWLIYFNSHCLIAYNSVLSDFLPCHFKPNTYLREKKNLLKSILLRRNMPDYIFVYGLLKSMYNNEAAKFIRQHCTLVGTGTIPGRLFDLGTYPGMVYEPNAKTTVLGEVFKINSNKEGLTKYLDEFEECGPEFEQPNEYRKEIILTKVNGATINASSYIYNRNLEGLKMIDSGNYDDVTGTR